MKKTIETYMNRVDASFLKRHTRAMMELELPQTSPAMERSSRYAFELLKNEGFDAELLAFPGDGRTDYQDKIMPLNWDATYGRLTVLSPWDGDPVVADYEKEPFALIRYSVPTPEGGLVTRLIPWDRMKAGEDVTGALVLLPQGLYPTDEALVPILNAGAAGLVNGTARGAALAPDCTHWANNCTETNSWYVNADERPFVGFCVTPRVRDALEAACEKGEVIVKAETDSHRYEGTIWGVTALLPGETDREVWLLAHLTEPLEDDNSAGVACGIEILRCLRGALEDGTLAGLRYGVRVLFGPELYGFAAMADHFGGILKDRCIGSLNMDGMPLSKIHPAISLTFAPPAVPFYGNAIMEGIAHSWNNDFGLTPLWTGWNDHYDDDCFMSDASVGNPTLMPMHPNGVFWHNSVQRDGYIDYEQMARVTAMYAAFAAETAGADPVRLGYFLPKAVLFAELRLADLADEAPSRSGSDEKARMEFWTKVECDRIRDFGRAGVNPDLIDAAVSSLEGFGLWLQPKPASAKTEETPAYDSAAKWIPERTGPGFPHDLAKVPKAERWYPLHGNLTMRVFSSMDGRRDLKDLITQAEWEERRCWDDAKIADFIESMKFLAKYGYLKLKEK